MCQAQLLGQEIEEKKPEKVWSFVKPGEGGGVSEGNKKQTVFVGPQTGQNGFKIVSQKK